MKPMTFVFACFVLAMTGTEHRARVSRPAAAPQVTEAKRQEVLRTYSRLPLSFEDARGQSGGTVDFISRGSGYTLYLASAEAVLSLPGTERAGQDTEAPAVLRMKLEGANPAASASVAGEQPGRVHYFVGNDPKRWRTGVATYGKVQYTGVYPGIDLVYYGNQRDLEFDFVVAPGADPKKILVAFEGACSVDVDPEGDLILQTAAGRLRQRKPVVYQEVDGVRREVAGSYVLAEDNRVRFEVAPYDAGRPLILDPVLSYSTYLGGTGAEQSNGIGLDSSGAAYIVGETGSSNFPTSTALQSTIGGGAFDAFVTKLNAAGTRVYSTYLGGTTEDRGRAVAVDSAGAAYVTGFTNSANFPLIGAVQGAFGGGSSDAFVTKLNAGGSALVFSTFVGGIGQDSGEGIVVDSSGNVFVTGATASSNFPTIGAIAPAFGGGAFDAFLLKLGSTGTRVFSTYLGGTGDDRAHGIAVDPSGNVYIVGETASEDFPTQNAMQDATSGGTDAFVTKFNATGSTRVYSTYLGGSSDDRGFGIAVDSSGSAYVAGSTSSSNFPTTSPIQSSSGGGVDGFVTKINAAGSARVYSTYLGGAGEDSALSIALDSSGNAYVTGSTASTNFPLTNPIQGATGGVIDAFVTKINAAGSARVYSTYLGGSDEDLGFDIAVDSSGSAYIVGRTASTNFATVNAVQSSSGGATEGFVSVIVSAPPTYFPQVTIGGGYLTTFTLINTGSTAATGDLILTDQSGAPFTVNGTVAFTSTQPGWNPPAERIQAAGSSFSVSVPANGTVFVTATALGAGDPARSGWARFESLAGPVSGVGIFELTEGGVLKTRAGVLASSPIRFATIPVDNDSTQERFTGFAVANSNSDSLDVRLVTVRQNGTISDDVMPQQLRLAARAQTAIFLHQILPATVNFKGSMVLIGQAGKSFAVVALSLARGGVLTTIPVLAEKPAGVN